MRPLDASGENLAYFFYVYRVDIGNQFLCRTNSRALAEFTDLFLPLALQTICNDNRVRIFQPVFFTGNPQQNFRKVISLRKTSRKYREASEPYYTQAEKM